MKCHRKGWNSCPSRWPWNRKTRIDVSLTLLLAYSDHICWSYLLRATPPLPSFFWIHHISVTRLLPAFFYYQSWFFNSCVPKHAEIVTNSDTKFVVFVFWPLCFLQDVLCTLINISCQLFTVRGPGNSKYILPWVLRQAYPWGSLSTHLFYPISTPHIAKRIH